MDPPVPNPSECFGCPIPTKEFNLTLENGYTGGLKIKETSGGNFGFQRTDQYGGEKGSPIPFCQ
jgi:hypothetical protein